MELAHLLQIPTLRQPFLIPLFPIQRLRRLDQPPHPVLRRQNTLPKNHLYLLIELVLQPRGPRVDHVDQLPDLDAAADVVVQVVVKLHVFEVDVVRLVAVFVPLLALLDCDGKDVLGLGFAVVLDQAPEDRALDDEFYRVAVLGAGVGGHESLEGVLVRPKALGDYFESTENSVEKVSVVIR